MFTSAVVMHIKTETGSGQFAHRLTTIFNILMVATCKQQHNILWYYSFWYYNFSVQFLPCCLHAAIFNSCRECEHFIGKPRYPENYTDRRRDNSTKKKTLMTNLRYILQNKHPINKKIKSCQWLSLFEILKKYWANNICLLPLVLLECSLMK